MTEHQPNQSPAPDPATWAALLARWVHLAQAAAALPPSDDADRWKASIAPAIGLHAIAMALAELDLLPDDERALGIDRAGVLIPDFARRLHDAWGPVPLPSRLADLIDDARRALANAAAVGVHWLVAVPRLVMPSIADRARELVASGWRGDLLAAPPGTVLFENEPALFARPNIDMRLPGLQRTAGNTPPLQIYRQISQDGARVERDLVTPLHDSLPPGRPILTPLIENGVLANPPSQDEAHAWRAQQERLLGDSTPPIVFETP